MVVYIEYAFMQNLILDGLLLYLALFTAKSPVSYKRLLVSATVGAIGALALPLLSLNKTWAYPVKILGGMGLCLLTSGRKRFFRVCGAFFGYSFAFAGAMFATVGFESQTSGYYLGQTNEIFVLCIGVILTLLGIAVVKKIRKIRAVYRHIYPCKIRYQGVEMQADGFLDSGNFAHLNGKAVCFVAPDTAYDLRLGEFWGEPHEQVKSELKISTLGGVKTLSAFLGVIEIETGEKRVVKQVYFAVSANIVSREYKLLLHSQILGDEL